MSGRFGLECAWPHHFGWNLNGRTRVCKLGRTRSRLPTGEIVNRDPSAPGLAGHFLSARFRIEAEIASDQVDHFLQPRTDFG